MYFRYGNTLLISRFPHGSVFVKDQVVQLERVVFGQSSHFRGKLVYVKL